jgi:hypothetical protein
MFAYLYSEIVQYHQNRVDSISELERKLEATGYGVGLRVLELLTFRTKDYTRETSLMNMLQFVSTTAWKSLFGKAADSLERSIDHADEYMIVDYAPITRYACVNCFDQSVFGPPNSEVSTVLQYLCKRPCRFWRTFGRCIHIGHDWRNAGRRRISGTGDRSFRRAGRR